MCSELQMSVRILETNCAHRRYLTSSQCQVFTLRSSGLLVCQIGTNFSEEPAFSVFRSEGSRLHGGHCVLAGLYTVVWMCGIAAKYSGG